MAPSAPPRLVALSPGDVDARAPGPFLDALARALEAGLPALLLREPRLEDRSYLALARAVRALRPERPFWFAVHDRAHLAQELGADALHLSFRSLAPAELRAWLDPGIALGLSTHAHDDPRRWSGADYLFHGPLHATPSKAGLLEPLGLDGLAAAVARAEVPVLALGGVRPADVRALRARGLHGVVARAGLLAARDPAAATHAFLAELA